MYHIDIDELEKELITHNLNKDVVAEKMGIDRSTFYRRLKHNKLLVGDVHKLCEIIPLTREKAIEIFLAE